VGGGGGGDVGARARVCACASVALLIQHATRMRHIICGLSGSTTFIDIISQTAWFSEKKKKKVTERKMSILIFSTTFILNISYSTKNIARYCHEC
jgi:hypothetical protein